MSGGKPILVAWSECSKCKHSCGYPDYCALKLNDGLDGMPRKDKAAKEKRCMFFQAKEDLPLDGVAGSGKSPNGSSIPELNPTKIEGKPYWETNPIYLNPNKEPEPILTWGEVNGIPYIEKQGIVMIIASIGQGKSAAKDALMLAIATGKQIGNFKPYPGKLPLIVNFDTEMPENDLLRRIQTIKKTNGGIMPDNLRIVPLLGETKQQRMEIIKSVVEGPECPDIIVFDTVQRLTRDFNDNVEADEFGELLMPLTKKITIVGITHLTQNTNKAKGHLGTNLEELAQEVFIAKRDKGGIFRLETKKKRNVSIDEAESVDYRFCIDKTNGYCSAEETVQKIEQTQHETWENAIREYLTAHPGECKGSFMTGLNRKPYNIGLNETEKCINWGVENGIIKRKKEGKKVLHFLEDGTEKSIDFDNP